MNRDKIRVWWVLLRLRFWLWRYFLSHGTQDFKWALKRAGFTPSQIGPGCWRWEKSGCSVMIRRVDV